MQTATIEYAAPLERLFTSQKRVKIAVGGRGSAKSTGVGDYFLACCAAGERLCCTREFQNSIDDSVHENLKLEIERLGLEAQFDIKATEIRSIRGGEIFYKGLARNITSLKSLAGVKKLWIEEGESVSANSLKVLTPSVRSSAKSNVTDLHQVPEIWITMNRGSSKDAISQKYLHRAEPDLRRQGWYEDDLMIVVEVNWRDNPWFPPELQQEREDDYQNLPRAEYLHIWEGQYADTVANAIIDPEWFDACIDAHIKLGFDPLGQERVAYDPADSGDAKAIAYSHGTVILDVQSTQDGRVDTATDWATSYAIDKRPDVFTWDADGMGMGLKRQIASALEGKKIEAIPFRGSEGVDEPDLIYERLESDVAKSKRNKEMFTNKRAQYYWLLRDRIYRTYLAIEKGGKVYNPDELISFSSNIRELAGLRSEICSVPRKYNASGRIQILSKPDMLKQDILSPNMADAVMMLMRKAEPKAKTINIDFEGWK